MKLTKKLFIAIMTMALLVVTFTASTFAWFTLGQESKIDNFQVNVKSMTGMEISTDGKTWKNNIALDGNSIKFADLTSSNGVNVYEMNKVNNAAVAAKSNLTAGTNDTPVYFEQVIYVRITKNNENSTGDYSKIILKSVSGQDAKFVTADGASALGTGDSVKPWLADATLSGTYAKTGLTENEYYRFDSLNAVKISFTANSDTKAKFIYGYENAESWGGASSNGLAKDYAVAKSFELGNAVEYGLVDGLDEVTYGKNTNAPAADGTTLITYDTVAENAEKSVVLAHGTVDDFGTFASKIQPDFTETIPADEDNYTYAKLTIRVWLEGWDADCINAILEQVTKFSIVLSAE